MLSAMALIIAMTEDRYPGKALEILKTVTRKNDRTTSHARPTKYEKLVLYTSSIRLSTLYNSVPGCFEI